MTKIKNTVLVTAEMELHMPEVPWTWETWEWFTQTIERHKRKVFLQYQHRQKLHQLTSHIYTTKNCVYALASGTTGSSISQSQLLNARLHSRIGLHKLASAWESGCWYLHCLQRRQQVRLEQPLLLGEQEMKGWPGRSQSSSRKRGTGERTPFPNKHLKCRVPGQ